MTTLSPDETETLREVIDSTSSSDPAVRVEDDAVLFTSRPSGAVAHVLILLLFFAPPILILIEGREISNFIVAFLWLVVFSRSFWSIFVTDIRARVDGKERSLTVANMNPVILWLKRRRIPLRGRWEGAYPWSALAEIRVRRRIHTKSLTGHLVVSRTVGGRAVPIAEFQEEMVARKVATVLSGWMGVDLRPPP